MSRWASWAGAACAVLVLGVLLPGCGGGSSAPPPPVPFIQNINSSTTPTSPLGFPIEINGTGFQSAPGKVVFTQSGTSVDVVPAASAWSDAGIVAAVPATLTAPGMVSVTVVTSGGTSNAVALSLVVTNSHFTPSQMGWTTTTHLPNALTGLRAVAVPGATSTTAFAVVTGGFDGTNNRNFVWANNLNQDGTVGSSWTTITAALLPTTLAHHAMAEADDTNSLVPVGKRFVYVIGGQVNSGDVGGTNAVYVASLDATAGTVGAWTTLTSTPLPQALMGLTATIHNGFLYVAGGLNTTGTPVSAVYSAPVNPDGTIGTWTTSANTLPTARAFGTMLVFAGTIFYIDGDPNASIPPNNQGVGDKNVYFASALRGVVGTWTLNANSTIHDRAKGILFTAFGQVISGEGVYTGSVGSGEMESSVFNSSNTSNDPLLAWTGLTGSQDPSANVYNAAGFTSPLFNPTVNGPEPRFLILGGQALTGTTGAGGPLSSAVFYNNAP